MITFNHPETGVLTMSCSTERVDEHWSFRIKSVLDLPNIDFNDFSSWPSKFYSAVSDTFNQDTFYLTLYPEGYPNGKFPLKDWKIRIPNEFRAGLEKKFSLTLDEFGKFSSHSNCEFCWKYINSESCASCPFGQFESEIYPGCVVFLKHLQSRYEVDFKIDLGSNYVNVADIANFNKFVEFARNFIEFE